MRLLAIPISLAMILSACGGGGGTAPGAPGSPAAAQVKLTGDKIVLGVINDQSGVYADLSGKNAVEAVKMAVADYQAKFPDFPKNIEVITADHQNKPDLAKSKAQEMYERSNANIILDVPTSSAALAIADVAKEQKKLYINITAGSTDLTSKNCNKYTFHYAYDNYMLGASTGTWATQNLGKTWYIVYPDYAFGQDLRDNFKAAIEKAGGKVLAADGSPFPNQTGDYSNLLIKAGSVKPEILGVMHAGGDLVNVVKQYNQFKLKDQKIQLAIGLLFDTDIAALGPDAFAGVVYTTPWLWTMDDQARGFGDKFKAKTGIRPTFAHAGNYSAAWQYLDAVRRAGTDDADKVVAALEGYKFNDFFIRNGEIRAADHYVAHDALLAQVKPQSEVKEPGDYSKVLGTLKAADVSRPVSEANCRK